MINCTSAQADLSLRWPHVSFCGFVVLRLKWRWSENARIHPNKDGAIVCCSWMFIVVLCLKVSQCTYSWVPFGHTCQLSPINSESSYFGRHSHSPSLFCQKWPNLPIWRAFPYFCWIFKIFPLNHIKFPKHLPHGNCYNFGSAHSFA